MKLPQNRWTVDDLASLPDDELERFGRKVAGNMTVSKLITGRVMLAMQKTGLPERRGLKWGAPLLHPAGGACRRGARVPAGRAQM